MNSEGTNAMETLIMSAQGTNTIGHSLKSHGSSVMDPLITTSQGTSAMGTHDEVIELVLKMPVLGQLMRKSWNQCYRNPNYNQSGNYCYGNTHYKQPRNHC